MIGITRALLESFITPTAIVPVIKSIRSSPFFSILRFYSN